MNATLRRYKGPLILLGIALGLALVIGLLFLVKLLPAPHVPDQTCGRELISDCAQIDPQPPDGAETIWRLIPLFTLGIGLVCFVVSISWAAAISHYRKIWLLAAALVIIAGLALYNVTNL